MAERYSGEVPESLLGGDLAEEDTMCARVADRLAAKAAGIEDANRVMRAIKDGDKLLRKKPPIIVERIVPKD